MATYDRDQFSTRTKEWLLDYIEQQIDHLSRFETRFRDVVRAYKGLLKEKEALEASLKALSIQQIQDEVKEDRDDDSRREGEEEVTQEGTEGDSRERDLSQEEEREQPVPAERSSGTVDGGNEASDKEGHDLLHSSEETQSASPTPRLAKEFSPSRLSAPSPVISQGIQQLKQQLATLTSSMATLMEEKSKMEVNFQTDKKAILSQQDALNKQHQAEKETAKAEISELHQRLEEVRESLRSEQHSREEEQLTHAEVIKELQTLISAERDHKEALQLQLNETTTELERLQEIVAQDRVHDYEERVKSLSIELVQVRSRLQAAEKKANEPPPLLLKLQEELAQMKEAHQKSIQREQQRANEAEERLKKQSLHEERRVGSLETKLSSLSETVGNYDRQREQDQTAILKLKERITQLDSENTALTRAHIERQEAANTELTGQVTALQEKVGKLKALLKLATVKANEKATLPANVEELSVTDYAELLSSEPSRKEYQQELFLLKEEFERYKTRAQSVLKNRGNKDSDATNREIKELQQRNNELQRLVDSLRNDCEELEEKHVIQTQKLREEMRALHNKHKQESASLDASHKNKLHELQQHVQSTRDRTLKLLAEKDVEIQRLRSELYSLQGVQDSPLLSRRRSLDRSTSVGSVSSGIHEGNEGVSSLPVDAAATSGSSNTGADSLGEPNNDAKVLMSLSLAPTGSTTVVQELLEQQSPSPSINGGRGGGEQRHLFHLAQEQHRRDSEVATARRRRLELEDTVRELQEREQRHIEQNTILKEEIRKLERGRSRETENLEYLKNVVVHYMSADSAGRDQLLMPLATVLHLSPEESMLTVPLLKHAIYHVGSSGISFKHTHEYSVMYGDENKDFHH